MSKHEHTDSGAGNQMNRRRFFYQSGAAILGTTLLTSCEGILDKVFPGKQDKGDQTLAFFGDSLTEGIGSIVPYPTMVGQAMSGRRVVNEGLVGQLASQISIRQGGTPVTVSISGGKFDGANPVEVTRMSNAFLSTMSNANPYFREGKLADVPCTIKRDTSRSTERYIVTPKTASDAVVPDDSVFVIDRAEELKTATQILWYGRNNIAKGNAEGEIVKALDNSIAFITEPRRYIVLGVLVEAYESEGSSNFNEIMQINRTLASKYGKNYVEMTPPTEAEMKNVGYTPSSNDLTDIANKNFPKGMRPGSPIDGIHLNQKGYQIIANRVIDKLKELDY